jgi:ApaG protein
MDNDGKYRIDVAAQVNYLSGQSSEDEGRYVFAYTIHLTNTGQVAAQLISRHWVITDSNQQVQEVRGTGVVGEQPTLKPGESYEYSSGTVLATQVGIMAGSYHMRAEDGTEFDAPIPQFVLSVPRVLH